jgi:hypothetical protein
MPETIFLKLHTYITAPGPINGILHKYPPSVCVPVHSPISARQQLSKNITAATNTHATIEELLDASFSVQFVLYQRKVGDQFFPEFFVILSVI